jgi:probable HAF family extracellular repeat protein
MNRFWCRRFEVSRILRSLTIHRRPLFVVLLLFALPWAFVSGQPAAYTFTTIDAPYPGAFFTDPTGINDVSQVVGSYFVRVGRDLKRHGFLWQGGVFTAIEFPGAVETIPTAINATGDIVGSYADNANGTHGFLRHQGAFTTIDAPGAAALPASINAAGQVVGNYYDVNGRSHGFLWDAGTFTTIDVDWIGFESMGVHTQPRGINAVGQIIGTYFVPSWEMTGGFILDNGNFGSISWDDALSTFPLAVNDNGQVVGGYRLRPDIEAIGSHAFQWRSGLITNIDPPGTVSGNGGAYTAAINAVGEIVGSYYDDFRRHAFLLEEDRFSRVNPEGSTDAEATGINAAGQIIGHYDDGAGVRHGFLAIPKPVVNDLVNLAQITSSFYPTPVPGGPAGTYTIRATFKNVSASPIDGPVFKVKQLSGENLLLNADGGPGGVGALLVPDVGSDANLSPNESLTATFVIGLHARRSFTFLVDILGMPEP